jgi:hypothetical protein
MQPQPGRGHERGKGPRTPYIIGRPAGDQRFTPGTQLAYDIQHQVPTLRAEASHPEV